MFDGHGKAGEDCASIAKEALPKIIKHYRSSGKVPCLGPKVPSPMSRSIYGAFLAPMFMVVKLLDVHRVHL